MRAAILALALLAAGCVPPRQAGEVVVASGASERLALAWRFGYAGAEGPAAPATARVLASTSELPLGRGSGARAGDVLLDNGEVSFVVAAADGTPRGGALVDAWSTVAADELGALRVIAADLPVLARSVRPGTDAPTRAAWVDVIGVVETPTGPIEVATRYDVAPGVKGVLVHSTLRMPSPSEGLVLAIGDVLEPGGGAEVVVVPPALGAPALLAQAGATGYAVLGVDGAGTVVDPARGSHGRPLASVREAPGEIVMFSRFVAVLDRPDPLAMRVVQARAAGVSVGEIEIAAVDARGLPASSPAGTRFLLEDASRASAPVVLAIPRALAPGEVILAEAPAGAWQVRLAGGGFESTPVRIAASQVARARVRVTQRSERPALSAREEQVDP